MADRRKLGELLIRDNLITPARLQKALEQSKVCGKRLGDILLRDGDINEPQLVERLSEIYQTPIVDLSEIEVNEDVLGLVDQKFAEKHMLIPFNRSGSTLLIAMSDPNDLIAVEDLKFLTGYQIESFVATESSIREAIETYYKKSETDFDKAIEEVEEESIQTITESEEADTAEKLLNDAKQTPIVKVVNMIIADAIAKKASDVHIEPFQVGFRIRHRIDGRLYTLKVIDNLSKHAIVSRIKVMSDLDISVRRLPQDGRMKVKTEDGTEMDLRVSITPTMHGEKVVLRLLDKSNLQLDLSQLGFEEEQLSDFQKAICKPYGMVLVTGQTGSGKTTTLYSALNELNGDNNNIQTIENPVEFDIPGISQLQVNEEIGLTFSAALRSFLRQDPDIIMLGEVRDFETAEIAVQAAQTGHLVLTTLHTNDAASSISRLLNMGIEPFLVADAVDTIIAQRLVRKLCLHCKHQENVSKQVLEDLQVPEDDRDFIVVLNGSGCAKCTKGFKGRIALYEVMVNGPELQNFILNGASTAEIKGEAVRLGMMTLRQSGIRKVIDGITTIGEVISSTLPD